MQKFIIEESFFEVFKDAHVGVLVINDVINTKSDMEYSDMIAEAMTEAQKYVSKSNFSENEVVSEWREAYSKFKKKKGARCSIEALLKRVANNQELPSINPLVDLYNCTSLKFGIPCGGEDIASFKGNVRLTKALGDELFFALGSDKSEPPYPDEIVYKDDEGIICRCFNWREAQRTLLLDETTNAFIVLEVLSTADLPKLEAALDYLKKQIVELLKGDVKTFVLNQENCEIIIKE